MLNGIQKLMDTYLPFGGEEAVKEDYIEHETVRRERMIERMESGEPVGFTVDLTKTPYERTKNEKNAWWAVKAPDGSFFTWTVDEYKGDSARHMENSFLNPWKHYYRKGYRVVRVRIVEVV